MFEAVGALFSVFVQSFVFLSANSNPIIWGVSTAKLSQSDLSVLRFGFFFTFEEAETAGGGDVCEGSDEGKGCVVLGFLFLLSADRQRQNSLLGSKVQERSRK